MVKSWIRIALIIAGVFCIQLQAGAQSANAPAFAVATIKPGQDLPGKGQRPYAGGYEAKRLTVEDLISFAYDLPWGTSGLVSGGPRWAYTDTFDIEAKSENATEGKPLNNLTSEQIANQDRLMLQSLLAGRFKLRVHREVKQVPGFALTVARGGPKLTRSKPPAFSADGAQSAESMRQKMRLSRGDIQAQHVTMGWLAGYLQFQPEAEGYSVTDNTGLTGEFDIALKWSPEGNYGTPAGVPTSDALGAVSQLPSLVTALDEQLGLKLERTRVPANSIVIDNVEKPSEN